MSAATQANRSPETHGGISKIVRHSWKTRGERGDFAWLPKGELKIDHTYQREKKVARVRSIANDWSWVACGAISVSLREVDGEIGYWVMDGQHRVEAALLRSDITTLPCMIFTMDDLVAESKGFTDTNLKRGAMQMVDRFRALLVQKDPAALAVQALVDTTARHVGGWSGAESVACVGMLMDFWRTDAARLKRLWPFFIEITAGKAFHQQLISGLFWLETEMERNDETILDRRWTKRMVTLGYDELLRSIAATASFMAQRTPKAAAAGIARSINHGLQRKLLVHGLPSAD